MVSFIQHILFYYSSVALHILYYKIWGIVDSEASQIDSVALISS